MTGEIGNICEHAFVKRYISAALEKATMAVACGDFHTVVIDENGYLFGFGNSNRGQLGTNVSDESDESEEFYNYHEPQKIDAPVPVRQVAAGALHTGIVTKAGGLLMCGRGRYGRLGLGDEDDRATPTQVARTVFDGEAVLMVACGEIHTVVATYSGSVFTFGSGACGRLGHYNGLNQLAPRRVSAAAFNGERIVMVAAGFAHTVALSEAGHVFTWGYGGAGQLGHDDRDSWFAPQQVEPGRFAAGGEPSGRGERVVFVAAGGEHTVAVTVEGRLFTWGAGDYGQQGHGDTDRRLVPTLVGPEAFGAPEGGRVVMAACGGQHTLVVTQDGALWVCGMGSDGQLGLGDLERMYVFEQLGTGAFGGARVVAAAAGYSHSAAVTEDGALWTWGKGWFGQLGQGEHMSKSSIPRCVYTDHLQNRMLEEEKKAFRESFRGKRLFDELQRLIFLHFETLGRSAKVKH